MNHVTDHALGATTCPLSRVTHVSLDWVIVRFGAPFTTTYCMIICFCCVDLPAFFWITICIMMSFSVGTLLWGEGQLY